jgi:hypothetical protein
MATTSAPKSTGLKYTYKDGEGYREWYKANMGADWDGTYLNAKPEGMSDVDWTQGMMLQQFEVNKNAAAEQKAQTGQQLTDIYNQQTSAARKNYQSMANQYDQQMKSELGYEGVLHERMKKHLPQQMKAAGMGNMGIMQTAWANATAKHMSNRASIIGQNQSSMNELNRNYGERQAALDAGYKSDMMAADTKYNDRMSELEDQLFDDEMELFGQTVEEKKAEQDEYYMAGLSSIKDAKTREDALAVAEQMRPYISESQYNALVVEANNRGNKLDDIAEEEREKEYDQNAKTLESVIEDQQSREDATAWLDTYINSGLIPESMRTQFESLIDSKFDKDDKLAADEEHKTFYDNVLSYIAFAAADYDDAWRYAVERRDEFSDTEWESIEIQLATRKKADDEAKLANQSAEQAEAESRFVDQMSLYASSADATAKISALLESYKERLHPDVYNAWKMYLDDLADNPNQQLIEQQQATANEATKKELAAIEKGYESAADYDAAVLNGNESVEFNGAEYKIIGGEISLREGQQERMNEAFQNLGIKNANGNVLTNPNGPGVPNGTVVQFARGDKVLAAFGNLGIGQGNTQMTVIYYNGKWYECEATGTSS